MLNFGAAPFGVTHRHLLSGRCRQGIVIGRFLGCARDDNKGGVPGMKAVAAENRVLHCKIFFLVLWKRLNFMTLRLSYRFLHHHTVEI